MLTLSVLGTLAKTITASKGIPDQELTGLYTGMRRYIEDFLKERQKGEHAWSMNPYDKSAVEQVKEVAARAKADKIRTVVWIGIGGSGLGPKVIQEVFEGPDTVEFILLDTLDPAVLEMYLSIIDWKQTMVVVASKSGGTLEPMSVFFLCWAELKKAKGDKAADRVVALTDPDSGLLRSFCLERGISMLPIPTAVGGRYSIFTAIGLLPLALLDADVDQFIRGAKDMDTICQKTSIDDNPAALLASVQFLLDTRKGYPVRVIMPYSQRLESIARWGQQLIAESLGKTELANPIPFSAIGTQDQHSLLQQWMAGPRKMWHLFIREEDKYSIAVPDEVEPTFSYIIGKPFGELLDACYKGTSQALTAAKRPHATISMPKLDEYHLGQLFELFLVEVILLGKLYRIDPYGQPAVEIGKNITKELLGGKSH
ncbi:hypothetical protein COU78_03810 [Candidatus Peregrinibacteria bacterium CG10_big_fil_rev_8_21_14_0_10_49_24]|nr:MAG: hypothetical protein COV83_05625 [Candidatus Peregrinibacteria bacterium CG11_big_fil_rev_8_21_14_0_20_49_14]PIR51242.1 MAG: hypothetical protein COU78_03810 [Candidatus Peregrinibacteria bacterium CG10_big_fil_rev_8_21_14_0_10_49_24]PJA67280.1 MAG: hypothetical protein CO157_05965 [Candidatus Peregrinibacteria bacterium CG_4_9_14_3_um_filter_49_12]